MNRRGFVGTLAALIAAPAAALKAKFGRDEGFDGATIVPLECGWIRMAVRLDTPRYEDGSVNESMLKFLVSQAKETLVRRGQLSGLVVVDFREQELNYGDEYGVRARYRPRLGKTVPPYPEVAPYAR